MKAAYFFSFLFVGLSLGPSLAHLLELPNKIGLPADDYLRVQQIYRGWAWLGIVVIGAILSTAWLAFVARRRPGESGPALVAFLGVVAAHIVFWMFTYPANAATDQWQILPAGWEALRTQWEYSHATGAVLNLTAFIALIVAVLRRNP